MHTVRDILRRIGEILQAGLSGDNVKVGLEYPPRDRDYPLAKTTVVAGLASAETAPGSFGGYFGRDQSGAEVCGRKLEVTVRITLHIPKSGDLNIALALFAKIAELLLFSELRPIRVSSDELRYDRALGHYIMNCSVKMTEILSQSGEPYKEIGDIIVKGVV